MGDYITGCFLMDLMRREEKLGVCFPAFILMVFVVLCLGIIYTFCTMMGLSHGLEFCLFDSDGKSKERKGKEPNILIVHTSTIRSYFFFLAFFF